jgi:hypothetical protein
VKQHSFGWLLGCHGPFDQCVHLVFGFELKRRKAGSVVPPALLQVGCCWLSGYSLSRSSRSSWQHSQRQRESLGFDGLGLTMWIWAPSSTSSPVVTSPQSQQGKRI